MGETKPFGFIYETNWANEVVDMLAVMHVQRDYSPCFTPDQRYHLHEALYLIDM